MYSSHLERCLVAGQEAFAAGLKRSVPNQYARMDITVHTFLKGWDSAAAAASRKANK